MTEQNVSVTKLSIPLTLALVLLAQTGAFMWAGAKALSTIDANKQEITELKAQLDIERQVNLQRDVEDLKEDVEDLEKYIVIIDQDITALWAELF